MSNQPAQQSQQYTSTDQRQQSLPMSNAAANADGLPPIISEILSATTDAAAGLSKKSRYELLKTQIAPGCTDEELALLLYTAKSRGLDVFGKQLIARKQRQWNSQKQDYEYKMIMITTIDGFRLKAARTKEHTQTDDAVFVEDPRLVHPLNPAGLVKITVTVYRNGKPFPGTVYWNEFKQTYDRKGVETLGSQWDKMPRHMGSKCAESLALRKAFPEELGNLFTEDEIESGAAMETARTAPVGNGTATSPTAAPSTAAPQPTAQTAQVTPKKEPVAETPEWLAKEKEASDLVAACKTKADIDAAMKKLGALLPKKAPPTCRQRVGQLLNDKEEEIARAGEATASAATEPVDPQASTP